LDIARSLNNIIQVIVSNPRCYLDASTAVFKKEIYARLVALKSGIAVEAWLAAKKATSGGLMHSGIESYIGTWTTC